MLLLNADMLKPERQKLLKARRAQEAWLRVAVGREVRNVQMLAEQKRLQVQEEARSEERQRQAERHAKCTNVRKKRILDLREEAAKAKAELKAFAAEEQRALANSVILAKDHKDGLIHLERRKLWADRSSTQSQAQSIYRSIKNEVARQKVASCFDARLVGERAHVLMEQAFQSSGPVDA